MHDESIKDLRTRADKIRREMGGADKVERIRAAGGKTIRDHIDGIIDPGTFRELGTFARSLKPTLFS